MKVPNLSKCVVYTKNNCSIGWVDDNLIRSIDKGFFFNGVNVGAKGHLSFYGYPNGEDVIIWEFFLEGESKIPNPVKRVHSSYEIPANDIIFIYDLKPMMPSKNVPEKRQVEQRSILADVLVYFIDFGATVKGKTYLHKSAYDEKIIWIESKYDDWFILQHPEFPDGYSRKFNEMYNLTKIANDYGFELDHIMIRKDKVCLAI